MKSKIMLVDPKTGKVRTFVVNIRSDILVAFAASEAMYKRKHNIPGVTITEIKS